MCGFQVQVDSLSVVLYECRFDNVCSNSQEWIDFSRRRSLERILSRHQIELASPLDSSEPSESQLNLVASVVGAAEDENYWYYASKDGNREGHYTSNIQRMKTNPPLTP